MDYVYEISPRSGTGSTMFQTHRIEQEFIGYGAYRYKYDKKGNIISIESGSRNSDATACSNYTKMISYYYDNLDELVREDNKNLNQTITYTYDGAGNITSKNIYAYTTGEITGNPTQSYSYSYNDMEWKDLLTSYNGEEITYDAIGNPTSYLGSTLTWKGHQLSNITKGSTKASYTYDANGLRTTKTVNGTKTYYQYSGDKLIYQETGNKRLYFWYDAFGCLCEVLYDDNGTASAYMAVCNSRGDVERLYNADGTLAARYVYDSWGNVISVVDQYSKPITNQNAIGNVNPIRYRGYYLDSETGYYYLQSRYYNPQIGRFLNADLYCDTETGILGTNMFTYCENNPVMRFDSGGQFWDYVFDAAFVCWSIYDVVNNPSDWKSWVALGVDVVFAVLPFVPSGAGQIIKVGNKVDNALEVASSIRKMDKVMDISKVTLIGRRMERVTRTAIAIGKADNCTKHGANTKG